MSSSVRCLVLLTSCALWSACSDKAPTTSEAHRARSQETPTQPATPSEQALGAALTATAPVQPASVADAVEIPKEPEATGSFVADALPHADEPEGHDPVDFDRPLSSSEVKIDRFVLATGVAEREPLDESDTFSTETDRIFAFVQLANPDGAPYAFTVHFEPAEGPAFPYGVKLEVPTTARFRTWAWTRIKREPGQYRAVLRTLAGEEIASRTFTIEAPAALDDDDQAIDL